MTDNKRNPNWTRDETILALDLYFDLEGKNEEPGNPKIVELSKLLNTLSTAESKLTSFRNPEGVAMKLQNLRFFDPSRNGGLPAGSKLDKQLMDEFFDDRSSLKVIASLIKKSLDKPLLVVPDLDEDIEVKEGKRIQRLHFSLERNKKIVAKKKATVLEREGRLCCEVCEFDFYKVYGTLGLNYIECHHRVPLHKLEAGSITKLVDLALVCSNCHRMLHRGGHVSVEQLKLIIIEKISHQSII